MSEKRHQTLQNALISGPCRRESSSAARPKPTSSQPTSTNRLAGNWPAKSRLAVVVQLELLRRRAQAGWHDLLVELVPDVCLDQVLGEHVAGGEEVVILLQRLERPVQGVRHGRDVLQLLRRQLVEVLIHRITWLDAVLDAVQASHHRGGEREVRVTRRVRRTELDALGLRVGA